MKRSFVRGLWGNIWTGDKGNTIRGSKIVDDIRKVFESKYQADFVTYVFGEDNYKELKLKFDGNFILADDRPTIWNMKTELYRHKLEIIKRAMEDYDQIAFLDWDCVLKKSLPLNVWDILDEGETCQANLFQYRTKKCLWRDKDWRKTCNGGFIYVADKAIPDKFIRNWDDLRVWALKQQDSRREMGKELRFREKCLMFDDEPAISKYIDDCCGGWPGVEEYWNNFEPKVCRLRKKSAFTQEQNESKNACFVHML